MNTKKVTQIRDKAHEAANKAQDFAGDAKDKVEDYYKDSIEQVQKHPVTAILLATVIGVLLGKIYK